MVKRLEEVRFLVASAINQMNSLLATGTAKIIILFNRRILTIILLLCSLFFSCADRNPAGKNHQTDETCCPLPARLDDGWEVARLSDVGLDPDLICHMIKEIEGWDINRFNSILIVKDGKLVLEKYYPGHLFDFNVPA